MLVLKVFYLLWFLHVNSHLLVTKLFLLILLTMLRNCTLWVEYAWNSWLVFTFLYRREFLSASTGPVMTKFTIALREIGTYKEVLRSQVKVVDHFLRICSFLDLLLHCGSFAVE